MTGPKAKPGKEHRFIRVTDEMHEMLKASAIKNGRSITTEIHERLRESFDERNSLASKIDDLDQNIQQLVKRMGGKTLS